MMNQQTRRSSYYRKSKQDSEIITALEDRNYLIIRRHNKKTILISDCI